MHLFYSFLLKKQQRCTHCQQSTDKWWDSASQNDITTSATLGTTGWKGWQLQSRLFADADGSETLSVILQPKIQFPGMLARWSFVCVVLATIGTLVMSHKSNSVELVGLLFFTDIYSRSRSSKAFETRKNGFPPFVNSKTVDSWWISALFDLKLLNMLKILF